MKLNVCMALAEPCHADMPARPAVIEMSEVFLRNALYLVESSGGILTEGWKLRTKLSAS